MWIEDNPKYLEWFEDVFRPHFKVTYVGSFQDLKQLPPDVVGVQDGFLLDMELSDGRSGPEILGYLRSSGVEAPVLVLSNDESVQSKIEMLSLGSEDYLWKAMPPEEMTVRIRNSIVRHQGTLKNRPLEFEGLVLDASCFSSWLNHESLDLSKTEFHFLSLVIRLYPEPVSLEVLRKEVWKMTSLEPGTVNTFIWKINKKLEPWWYRLTKDGGSVTLASKTRDQGSGKEKWSR